MSGTKPAVVFCGGDPPSAAELAAVPPNAYVIAADHGLDHARAAGLVPDLVIGDLDSASASSLQWAEQSGVEIARFDSEKDHTDFQLAMGRAAEHGPSSIHVVGIAGGRLDHFLGNIAVLTQPKLAAVPCTASGQGTLFTVVHPQRPSALIGAKGSTVSLIPVGSDALGVSTRGLEYPLRAETLQHFGGRGISNVLTDAEAKVSVETGVVLAVQPEFFA